MENENMKKTEQNKEQSLSTMTLRYGNSEVTVSRDAISVTADQVNLYRISS